MTVVVVGAGIIGCATALELARAGCQVTLVERAGPGAEASGAAAGMLAPLGESSARGFRELAVASWRLYPSVVEELRARTGIDVEYVTRGTIYPLSRTPDESEARQWALGEEFRAEVLDAKEVHAREPALSPRIRGGIFVKGDHWVNNQRLVMAYAQAAVASGVELRTGCLASRLVVEGSRVRGVVADGERLDADQVLVTAGAWTADLLASIGLALPLEPRRGQMLALAHVPPVLTHCVHGEVYLVPRPSGELLVGATVERAGFQRAVTVDGLSGLLRGALDLVPDLAELSIARTWAGLRPWAVDALPVLGPWPGADGLWLATAHFRNGILLAPITARVMTEWMVQGRPPLDVEEFLPDRFQRGGPR